MAASERSKRPLRADAERNRQLILDAAKRAFARHGLGVRLDEIAEIAGVGVGTVYRRFEDKDALVAALFEQQIAAIVALADEALTTEDGTGLRRFLDRTADAMAGDRGLQQILTGPHESAEHLSAIARTQLEPRVTELLRRASAAGRIRPDVVAGDLPMIQVVLSTIIDMTSRVRPDLRRRYTQLLLDALEPHPGDTALPGPAPTPDEGVLLVERWLPPPRRPGARG